MVKLCFKKIWRVILYGAAFFAVYLILHNLLFSVSNFFKVPFIKYIIIVGIPALIISTVICIRRRDDGDNKRKYIEANKNIKISFRSEFQYMINFQEFLAEVISVTIITLFLSVIIAIKIQGSSLWYINLLIMLAVFLLYEILFIVFDVIIWSIVHLSWRKNNMHN